MRRETSCRQLARRSTTDSTGYARWVWPGSPLSARGRSPILSCLPMRANTPSHGRSGDKPTRESPQGVVRASPGTTWQSSRERRAFGRGSFEVTLADRRSSPPLRPVQLRARAQVAGGLRGRPARRWRRRWDRWWSGRVAVGRGLGSGRHSRWGTRDDPRSAARDSAVGRPILMTMRQRLLIGR
jgi:hypothetical protein